MFPSNNPLADQMAALMAPKAATPKVVLDAAADMAASAAADYAAADLRLKAASVVQTWAATTDADLDDGETLADRLLSMIIGVADANQDGELDDDESAVCEEVAGYVWDYLSAKGVSEDDCDALLNQWNADAAVRVQDVVAADLGNAGDEGADADLDTFAFDSDSDASVFDSAGHLVLDATYKKKVAIRNGKKVRINKRISGHVKLSAKQKVAIRKMLTKSHSSAATMRRMKSMRVRRKSGL